MVFARKATDDQAFRFLNPEGAHFKGRAEAHGLRTRELAGNARNRGPDFRYDEDSELASNKSVEMF
jgi:hypothetical protein